jgi:hypothetical protein
MSGGTVHGVPVRATNDGTGFNWRKLFAVPIVMLGAALGTASLFGEWSRAVLHSGITKPRSMSQVIGLLGLNYIYVGLLIALVTITALRLVSLRPVELIRPPVAGLVLTASLLMLLGLIAIGVNSEHPAEIFEYHTSGSSYPQVLGWGIYAAFGGVIALGAAQLLLFPIRRTH